jgi:hypothetical protein
MGPHHPSMDDVDLFMDGRVPLHFVCSTRIPVYSNPPPRMAKGCKCALQIAESCFHKGLGVSGFRCKCALQIAESCLATFQVESVTVGARQDDRMGAGVEAL